MAKDDKKTAAEIEAERRASLTQEQRDAEDAASATQAAQRAAAEEAANRNPNARMALDAQNRGILPPDNAPKDTRVVVAPGRSVYTEPNQMVPHMGGAELMVTAAEAERLRRGGHILTGDGVVVDTRGPQVYREAGLLVGHDKGQGQTESK